MPHGRGGVMTDAFASLAAIAVEIEKWKAVEAKKRQGARTDLDTSVPTGTNVEKSDDLSSRAASRAAKKAGISRNTLLRSEYVDEHAPDLAEKIEAGEMWGMILSAVFSCGLNHSPPPGTGGREGVRYPMWCEP